MQTKRYPGRCTAHLSKMTRSQVEAAGSCPDLCMTLRRSYRSTATRCATRLRAFIQSWRIKLPCSSQQHIVSIPATRQPQLQAWLPLWSPLSCTELTQTASCNSTPSGTMCRHSQLCNAFKLTPTAAHCEHTFKEAKLASLAATVLSPNHAQKQPENHAKLYQNLVQTASDCAHTFKEANTVASLAATVVTSDLY